MQDTPMLRGLNALRDAWLDATADNSRRLLVWRLPAAASRLLAAFFEMQRHDAGRDTPDFFLRLDTAYELGFRYSRQLKQDLLERYLASQEELRAQQVPLGWRGPHEAHPDSAHGVVEVLESFAAHHGEHLRLLAAVLEPERCVPGEGFERWVDAALAAGPGPRLRLVLVDTEEDPRWQPLLERHDKVARIVGAPVDMFAIARDTAAQSAGRGPQVLYRQLLADLMLLLERGSPAQVVARAERAQGLAQRQGWHDQHAVVQMMVAGAWLKHGDPAQAINGYRQARSAADAARIAGNPAAPELVMQSWFGEAGCWLAAKQPERAAQTYLQAATSAASIPHPMFALEGQRMAGWCLLQAGQREAARTQLLEAIRIAKPLTPADRKATTLPQALWDALQLQDARRCESLQQVATDYLQASTGLLEKADAQGRALGPQPPRAALDAIDAQLDAALEQGFHRAQQARERLVQGGDEFFRRIVAVGRDFLDAGWNGLPAIEHPLDHDVPIWSEPPSMQPLPDPAGLLQGPLQAGNPATPTGVVAA
ncbi:hypothetical protein [Stenotrophomonas sp. 24(2023)]|uniref:hypothetical protein n=1 Tax=Stenotrophomonas sp. 24(2023) TaxID=3068324 RepID=UPI0027DF83E8|nr:hypothetical protein [Stenotrophomonas sp. 24(2023)]WMJ69050.1 hypothetical protein Q9R17_18020 [Stenotrophomonas sp. 24(2023)]